MNVYWGGACLARPVTRMSQTAASVESRGINLMHSLFFLKAASSGGESKESRERVSVHSTAPPVTSRPGRARAAQRGRAAPFPPSAGPQWTGCRECGIPPHTVTAGKRGSQGPAHLCEQKPLGRNQSAASESHNHNLLPAPDPRTRTP